MATEPLTESRTSRRLQVRLVGEGALVGLAGGAVVTLYRLALSRAEGLLRSLTSLAAGHPLAVVGWLCALACMCAVVARLMRAVPETGGSGIPQVTAEVAGRMNAPWARVVAAKFTEGSLLALSGLSLGREGPSVQLGGMAGKGVARALGTERGEERLLVTCGAAAGMSAAFHAPLAGVLFALEEIHRQFTATLIISVMASSVAADFLVSQVLGVEPSVRLSFTQDLPHAAYPYVVCLGILCGVAGALHNVGMFACQDRLFARVTRAVPEARLAIPFALAGVAAFAWPQLMCGGDAIIELIARPAGLTLAGMLALLAGKYLFTALCFGSGAPGGTLLPMVVLGALTGLASGTALAAAGLLTPGFALNFAVLGIAGLFASVVRAPVTGVVLAFELTGTLDALLSASIVAILSHVTANLLRVEPFYERLLARQLGDADGTAADGEDGRRLRSYRVGVGAPVEGRAVSDVPWPRGALIVGVTHAGAEAIPKGSTRLCALDELLVLMDAHGEESVDAALRLLCAGSTSPPQKQPWDW